MAEYKDITKLKKEISDVKQELWESSCQNRSYITGYVSALSYVEGMIASLPKADVEPVKHGKWASMLVKRPDWKGNMQSYYQPNTCSECHVGLAEKTNYCPNCGAKNGRKGSAGMTTEKALEMIKFALERFPTAFLALNGTWGKCVEALEKQIPKKVNKFLKAPDGYLSNGDCPSCKERVNEGTMYCEACGQALDWSDDNA